MPSRSRIHPLAAALLMAAFGLSACRDTGPEGEYFQIAGKLFVFNYRVATRHLSRESRWIAARNGESAI